MKNGLPETRKRLVGLNLVILAAFALVAVAAAYWSIGRGPSILARGDNPRLVEEELRIQRGAIYDDQMAPLAVTAEEVGELLRTYPVPAAAPAVGYYSFRYGTTGIEEAYDSHLRGESGDFWSDFWHLQTLGEPQIGRDVQLTLNARWQAEASELLDGRAGAVLLFSLPDVAIRAMASQPGYDPNNLEADFESLAADAGAPLLNRVTQGQYQAGLLLQPFLLAIAQRDGLIQLSDPAADATMPVTVGGVSLTCQGQETGESMSWAEVLNARCPGPMASLAEVMGEEALMDTLTQFGLVDVGEDAAAVAPADARLIAIGQDVMAVNPLQVGNALAALANGGQLTSARLVSATEDNLGRWAPVETGGEGVQVLPASVAAQILAAFSQQDGVLEQEIFVLSGPEGELNSWYLGLAPANSPRYGVVVVVENDASQFSASEIGRDLLKSVFGSDRP